MLTVIEVGIKMHGECFAKPRPLTEVAESEVREEVNLPWREEGRHSRLSARA